MARRVGTMLLRRLVFLVLAVGVCCGASPSSSPCKQWEFRCANDRCISHNRFCDSTDDCGDGSDEPAACTNCNQSLMGEVGTKYPLRITEPLHRNLPFSCKLHLVAGGGNSLGERVEITFLSFQVGALSIDRNGSEDRLSCRLGHLRLSESHEDIFLGDDSGGGSPTLRSQQTRGFSQLISAFKEPRQLSTLYDMNSEPDFGLFCGSLAPSDLGVAFYSSGNNVTMEIYLPPRSVVASTRMGSFGLYLTYRFLSSSSGRSSSVERDSERPNVHFGNAIANTYCDKAFVNCDRKRCLIRSPNFPGLYLRNFTCSYYLRQDHVPQGKRAHLVVHQDNEYKISVNTGSSIVRSDSRKAIHQGGLTTDCAGDVVRIFDRIDPERGGGRLLLTEFCESGSLTDVISSGPEMLIQLYSASSNLLYESRMELEIRVEFTDINETEGAFKFDKDSKCEILIDGSVSKTGSIRSPIHSVPKNTTCTARLVGSSQQKVWLYFVSYFVKNQGTLGFDHHLSSSELRRFSPQEDSCDISSLEMIFDVQNRSRSDGGKKSAFKFCEATLPVMCTRTADYKNFISKRPCLPPSESYISTGPEVVIKYTTLMRTPNVVSSLSASSFAIRYEFVDSDVPSLQDAADNACVMNITSSKNLSGVIFSPKNVFMYGRGGRENLTCNYHFELNPKERVSIEVFDFRSKMQNCETLLDPLLKRFDCNFKGQFPFSRRASTDNIPFQHSFLSFTESSVSSPVYMGCICDKKMSLTPSFTSSSFEHPSVVTVTFDVSGMNAFEDFDDFQFEIRFRIIPPNTTDRECSVLPDSLDRNRTHGGELTFQAVPSHSPFIQEHLLRCRWFLHASSPDTYLYLQVRGKTCDISDEQNRVVLYSSGSSGLMFPKMVLCLQDPSQNFETEVFDFFSSSWNTTNGHQVAEEVTQMPVVQSNQSSVPDKVIVEFVAFQKGTLSIRWLEVTKPTSGPSNGWVYSDEGRTLRNVNCVHECPELSACINPELWCDGVVHCPHSGYDESSENCQHNLTLYVIAGISSLIVCVGIGLGVFFLIRFYAARRRSHQQTHPVTLGHRHHPPHCMQHNQNRELVSKSFSNASPVFMMGGGSLKKKKNKDDFIRHMQTMEVRFPDIHM